MGHHDDRCLPPPGVGAKDVPSETAVLLVECPRRLIGKENQRIVNGGADDRGPLTFPTRNLTREAISESGNPNRIQSLTRLLAARAAILAEETKRQCHILGNGQLSHQTSLLRG